MTRFLSICQNTFVQTIRQPIFSVLLVVNFVVLVMALPLTNYAMSTDYHVSNQKMLESLGLGTLLVMGLLAAAFSASGALSREIEDRTALTVISKPVARITFVLGKFAGVAAAVLLFYYLAAIVYLLTIRHRVTPAAGDPTDWPVIILGCSAVALAVLVATVGNFMFGWTFTSTAVCTAGITMTVAISLVSFIGKGWEIVPFGHELRGQLLVALLLLFMAVLVFVAVAIAASTRLSQVPTLLVCGGVFLLGSSHSYFFGYWTDRIILAYPLGLVCPRLDYFYALDALVMDKDLPLQYVATAAGYCALFVTAVLAFGAALFQRRQLESQGASGAMPGPVGLLAWAGRIAAVVAALVGLETLLSFLLLRHTEDPDTMTVWAPVKDVFFSPEAANVLVLIPAVGLMLLGVVGWLVWSCFGRGARWSYWLVLVLAAGSLAALGVVATMALAGKDGLLPNQWVLLTVRAVIAVAVLAMLLLPRTRRHFQAVSLQ